ncbi:hypothetical protein HBI56_009320 [Parastagonospora nodorum]|nr:hypothetical protein HBH53_078020 [Parastagonospora nodorum]KAH4033368.1 hypothetical protein HBI13_009740 [Parastagonospora nodorum]KAH4042176.1 hypothetical protein HBI09_009680 [Parastagonospora nodorum]KAH4212976.1 hypothetical protein HBI95_021330 [Parastagonospora nodorum]KAH4352768.1 hypothetical protein HBH98_025470 [Parastagonospora nodorum]
MYPKRSPLPCESVLHDVILPDTACNIPKPPNEILPQADTTGDLHLRMLCLTVQSCSHAVWLPSNVSCSISQRAQFIPPSSIPCIALPTCAT